MSEYNVSGHFVRPSRRMAPQQSQILLGVCKSDPVPPPTGRQLNDALFSEAARRKQSQLESAMWSGADTALSPSTRARIEQADNKWILGGATRRFAGASNRSNPNDLFCEPGAATGGAGVDITFKRGTRAGVHAAGTNSAEFVGTGVGYSVVGTVAQPVPEDHARGVRKVLRVEDNINHAGKPLPTPARERTPPPPMVLTKQPRGMRRVESPLRSDYVSEQWCRFGEPVSFHRKTGTRYFPQRSDTPTEVLPPPAPTAASSSRPASAPSSSAPAAAAHQQQSPLRHDLRPQDMLDRSYKPDAETPAAKAAAAKKARTAFFGASPQRREPIPFSAIGITKKDLRAEKENSYAAAATATGGSAARARAAQQNTSHISVGSSNAGTDVKYVPRKHMSSARQPLPVSAASGFRF